MMIIMIILLTIYTICILGDANRKHSKFKPDPSVPVMFSAHNSDYLGSGWSRGHMSPAGDSKQSQVLCYARLYASLKAFNH